MFYHVIFKNKDTKGCVLINCTEEMAKCAVDMKFEQKTTSVLAILKTDKTIDTKKQDKILKKLKGIKL